MMVKTTIVSLPRFVLNSGVALLQRSRPQPLRRPIRQYTSQQTTAFASRRCHLVVAKQYWGHPLLRDGCLRRSQGPSSLTGTGCVGSRVCRGRHRALPWCCGRRGGRLRHTGSFGHSVGHLYAYGTKKDLHNSTHSYFRGSNCWVVYLCEAEYYMVYWMTTKA